MIYVGEVVCDRGGWRGHNFGEEEENKEDEDKSKNSIYDVPKFNPRTFTKVIAGVRFNLKQCKLVTKCNC